MEFAGKGKKRPLLDLDLSKINLDVENPRLAKQRENTTQFDLIKTLYEEYDLEELAMSMSENGYFDEEPIIVIPRLLTEEISFDESGDTDTLQNQIKKLVLENKIEFTVVEGNRRIATAKILTSTDLRKKLNIREDIFPKPKSKVIEADLKEIPAIIYFDRKLVAPYLGVRHITGLLKWDAYAKANYIAHTIEESIASGMDMNNSIKQIQQQIADRSDMIKKQFLCFKVVKEAEEEISFDIKNIKDKFSLITVALNSPSIRNYIGCPSYKNVDFTNRIIPINKIEQLRNTLTWIYGDGKKEPILTDSRRITKELAPVLANKEATEYLIKNNNLEEAYERSEGEKDMLIRKMQIAKTIFRKANFYVDNHLEKDVLSAVNETEKALVDLKNNFILN